MTSFPKWQCYVQEQHSLCSLLTGDRINLDSPEGSYIISTTQRIADCFLGLPFGSAIMKEHYSPPESTKTKANCFRSSKALFSLKFPSTKHWKFFFTLKILIYLPLSALLSLTMLPNASLLHSFCMKQLLQMVMVNTNNKMTHKCPYFPVSLDENVSAKIFPTLLTPHSLSQMLVWVYTFKSA